MRLRETEVFAAQAARGTAKSTPSTRRDDQGTRGFAVETEARAGTRHALEAARGRAVAAADLTERRDAQRAVAERAGRASAASGRSSADIQERNRGTEPRRASDKTSEKAQEATERHRDSVGDRDDRKADATAQNDGAVASTDEEKDARADSDPSGERDEPAETPAASQATPGMTPPGAMAPAPTPAQQTNKALGQPGSSPAQAVAAAAQAEAASPLDTATEGPGAVATAEPQTTFAAHLDPVAALHGAMSSLGPTAGPGIDVPPVTTATPHQGAPVPLGAVPMTIGLRSLSGSSHFEIRLDPVDLGRIDVKLDIDKDQGTVTTRVVVERPETLALLQRDAGNLQQALNQAGLDSSAGISLSLRGDGTSGGRGSGEQRPNGGAADRGGVPASDSGLPQTITDSLAPRILRGIAGIDIRI